MVRAKKKATNDPSYMTLKADYYPTQRVINLRSTSVETDYYTLDVARCLSVANHRLYRQGKTYSVKLDVNPGATAAYYGVFALADTWYVQKAWQLGRSVYLRSTADERAVMSKQKIARWEDFRVGAGLSASTAQLVPAPFSTGLGSVADTAGEFDNSEITLSDGVSQRAFHWGATGGSLLGLLEEYDKTGNTDLAPSTASAANAYAGTDVGVHENQADDLASRGNAPPYDAVNFNPRVWIRIGFLDAASPNGKLSTGYFNAPCGLIAIQPSVPNTEITTQLTLTVQAGDYKGVKAMNMGV